MALLEANSISIDFDPLYSSVQWVVVLGFFVTKRGEVVFRQFFEFFSHSRWIVVTFFGATPGGGARRLPSAPPRLHGTRQLAVAGAIGCSARLLRERRARCGVCYYIELCLRCSKTEESA